MYYYDIELMVIPEPVPSKTITLYKAVSAIFLNLASNYLSLVFSKIAEFKSFRLINTIEQKIWAFFL